MVMTIYMQKGLQIPPLQAGLVVLPLALTFVIASRHSGVRAKHRGTLVPIEGCAVQIAGLAALVMAIEWIDTPSAMVLALVLTILGYGQRLVMAPLSSAVLSTVKPVSAGAASGIYGTTAQIANAAGVALAALALFALSIIACAAFLTWMRRVTG